MFTCGIPKSPSVLAMLIDGVDADSPTIADTAEDFEQTFVSLNSNSAPFAN